MKVDIRKFQSGGFATFTPLIESMPATAVPPSGGSANTGSGKEQSSILDQDLYKKLIEDGGLVNDVNAFVDEIQKLESGPSPFLSNSNRTSTLRMFAKVNELKELKENWKEAYTKAGASGGLNEVAVGPNSELYARDKKGKISRVSISDYTKHREAYNPMTVSELLEARKYDPQLTYDKNTFSIAANSRGLEDITKKIKGVTDMIGKETVTTDKYKSSADIAKQYSEFKGLPNPTTEQMRGLQELSSIQQGPNGIYKITDSTTSTQGHMGEALNYLWATLSKSEKDKLTANAAISGGSITDAKDILLNALSMSASSEYSKKVDYQKDATEGSGLSTGGAKGLGNMSENEIFLGGKFNLGETFKWNDPKSGRTLNLPITGKIAITDKGNVPIGINTLNVVNTTPLAAVTDTSNITFGGKKVKSWDMNKIVYDGTPAARTFLPINSDGTPNLTLLGKFEEVNKDLKNHPELDTTEEINKFYFDHGVPFAQVKGDRTFVTNDVMKPFMVMYGWSTDEVEAVKDNPNVVELTGEEGNKVNKVWNSLIKANKLTDKVPTGWFTTKYVKGMVAYPLMGDAGVQAAAQAGNLYAPKIDIETANIQKNIQQARLIPQGSAFGLK